MVLKIITVLSLSTLFLVANPIFADSNVVINEFYALGGAVSDPDWVELFNKSDSQEIIDSWVIRDSTDTNKIVLSGSICPHSFRKFNFSNRLNNSGDKIRLLPTEDTESVVDEITYFSEDISSHLQGQSTSRNPEGADSWTVLVNPSASDNISCNQSTPDPTPEPTTSTSQSTVSKTTSISIKTQSPIPTKLISKSPSPSPPRLSVNATPKVLGESTPSAKAIAIPSNPSPTIMPSENLDNQKEKNPKVAYFMTGLGTILIASSVILYFALHRKLKIKEDDQ